MFLNLNANIGTSHTSSQHDRIMNKNRKKALKRGLVSHDSLLEISAPQKMAFAGVGMPMNPVCCLSSILNFASLKAEKVVNWQTAKKCTRT